MKRLFIVLAVLFVFAGMPAYAAGVPEVSPVLGISYDGELQAGEMSASGKYLAVGTSDAVRLYDAGSGRKLREFPAGVRRDMSFSPDDSLLAVVTTDGASVYDMQGTVVAEWKDPWVYSVEFISGSQLLIGTGDGVVTYDVAAKSETGRCSLSDDADAIALSPTEEKYALLTGNSLQMRDFAGNILASARISNYGEFAESLSFTPDGGSVVYVDAGMGESQPYIYDSNSLSRRELGKDEFSYGSVWMYAACAGSLLVKGDEYYSTELELYDFASGEVAGVDPDMPHPSFITAAAEGNRFAVFTKSGEVQVYSAEAAATAKLQSIELTPPDKTSYPVGEKLDLAGMKLIAVYDDGTRKDVTAEAKVSGFDSARTGKKIVTVEYQGLQETFTVQIVPKVSVKKLIVSPAEASLVIGGQQAVTVTARLNDGSSRTVTANSTFVSSDGSVADVYDGIINAYAEGEASIAVSYMGFTKYISVEVSDAVGSIICKPDPIQLYVGGDPLQPKLSYMSPDGEKVDITGLCEYEILDESVAESDEEGYIYPLEAGDTTLTVSYGGCQSTIDIAVIDEIKKIIVTPKKFLFHLSESDDGYISVTGIYPDGSEVDLLGKTEMTSSNENIATVSPDDGYVMPLEIGKAKITVSYGKLKKIVTVTVKD